MTNKKLLTALSLLAATTSFAQPTLTAGNNNPVVGEIFYGHILDTTGKQKGAAGANVTWAFSGTPTGLDTTTYSTCVSTPSCDSFPGSNIVSEMGGDYTYFSANAGALTMLGANSGGQLVKLTNTINQFSYPFTYNDTKNDTGYAVINAGIVVLHLWTTTTTTADAWGTLTTPAGTFSNALRVHVMQVTKDSVDLGGMPSVNYNAVETYNWYAAGFHNPLLTMTYDTSGSGISHLTDIKYYTKNGVTSVNDVQHTLPSLSAYPSPATNELHIDWNGISDNLVTITISDITGRIVASIAHANVAGAVNTATIPVREYANGMYILHIRSSSRSLTQKILINK